MMNDVIVDINMNEPVGVTRFQILDDGTVKDFNEMGEVEDRKIYAIAKSRGGGSWSALGEMSRNDLIALSVLIHRFIEETNE